MPLIEVSKCKSYTDSQSNLKLSNFIFFSLPLSKRPVSSRLAHGFGSLNSLDREGIGLGRVPSSLQLPLFESRVQAGFPSPGDDFVEKTLDLNEHLILNKAATFFARAVGDSMKDVGIFPGDLLIVDRSLAPSYGKVIIAVFNGEMLVRRLEKNKGTILLCAENETYPDLSITEEDDFSIWGVVTNVIHSLL